MGKAYVIPQTVDVGFDLKTMPELSHRVYRVLWVSISFTGLHGERGVVVRAGSGPGPLNALVMVRRRGFFVVPRGNLVGTK